jgi:hypothetical protein
VNSITESSTRTAGATTIRPPCPVQLLLMPPDDWAEIPEHPGAAIFPMLPNAELSDLANSIETLKFLREPIVLRRGASGAQEIVDGRNRRAALRLLQERGTLQSEHLRFAELDPSLDPFDYIVAANLQKRHLSESQRAMLAAKLATMRQGARTDLSPNGETSQAQAADLLHVSKRSVERAAKVQDVGASEVIAAVEQGEIAVSAAVPLLELPKERQKEVLSQAIQEAGGGKLTAAKIEKMVKVATGETTNIHVSDDSYEWYTPARYIEAARELMGGIDLDPASSAAAQKIVQAAQFYTKETDGLAQPWEGRVFLNPPYSADLVTAFTERLRKLHEAGSVEQAVLLVNNCTDAAWFQALLRRYPVCFTAGRIKFWSPGREDLAARQGQAVFYLGDQVARFDELFEQFGTIVSPLSFRLPALAADRADMAVLS